MHSEGGFAPLPKPPPRNRCAGKAGARSMITSHEVSSTARAAALPEMSELGPEVGVAEHLRLLAPQHALGGGLRPPSETSPRNRCAGKAGARTMITSHEVSSTARAAALP